MKKGLGIAAFIGFMLMLFGAACADGTPLKISISIIAAGAALIGISGIIYTARYGGRE